MIPYEVSVEYRINNIFCFVVNKTSAKLFIFKNKLRINKNKIFESVFKKKFRHLN